MNKDKKKFDICLMNPPYQNGLHEKFLVKIFELTNNIISVQPCSWLLGQHQKTKITSVINKLGADIEKINGHLIFDAGICGNISINAIGTTNGKLYYNGKQYNKCEEISSISDDRDITTFMDHIKDATKTNMHDNIKATPDNPIMSMQSHILKNPNPEWWTFEIPTIRGNMSFNSTTGKANDFYTLLSKDDNKTFKKVMQVKDWPKTNKQFKWNDEPVFSYIYVAFDTYEELKNCLNYFKTDFCRICLYTKKDGQNLASGATKNIPWFDFSDPHFSKSPSEIDDYLFAKYNISDDIRNHIEEILPDYYGIRNKKD